MTSEDLRNFLSDNGVEFEERELTNFLQFRCASGEIFNFFHSTGTVQIQGKRTPLTETIEAMLSNSPQAPPSTLPSRQGAPQSVSSPDKPIFIVYGHDHASRDALELQLHRFGLEPIILQNLPIAGETIIEKLDNHIGSRSRGEVGFACVLLTPDDEGHRVGAPEEKKYRARQNVVFELGMVMARLGRRHVAILHKESVELPSDIAGLIYIPYTERVDEAKTQLFNELKSAGYSPDPAGLN